jgi:hypothetical protein
MEVPAFFWLKVKKGNPWECWPWTGGRNTKGYGRIKWFDKHTTAHRVAFFLGKGYWPKNYALHDCDYKLCCNYFHLYDGTSSDNINQAYERGQMKHKPPLLS